MPGTERLRAALSERYQIERELGSGGMATVYLARDVKHEREVALKVLRSDLSAVIGTERFLAEVRIAAKLDHPHILTLIDSGEADGILYYVLPYVRGESLRARLQREKQLGIDEALSITRQIASALDYAHAKGVVHRDIKPENILIHEGVAVLADFGIALAVKEAGGNRLTETGLSLGTPQYMSPEQATGDRTLDQRSDVYSLGAVFYEMIAGEPPVTGATAQAMIAKLLTEKPVKLRVVRESIPPAMERAAERALSKVPADRFPSAGEFARALAAAADHVERDASRAARWKWPLAGAVVLAAIAIGAFLVTRARDAAPHESVTLKERKQLTSSGQSAVPTISPDGKLVAYAVADCPEGRDCTFAVELQDLGGGDPKRLVDGITAVYDLDISPDRRNVLMFASYKGTFGSFIIPTLGGTPRLVATGPAAMYAGGDSLIYVRGFYRASRYWIIVSGLDGSATDSIAVNRTADALSGLMVSPRSDRILFGMPGGEKLDWVVIDRSGRELSSISMRRGSARAGAVSSDALWLRGGGGASTLPLIRIPFDAESGTLASRYDTVYTAAFNGFGVTADGTSLVLDEGTTEFDAWSLSVRDFLAGKFPRTAHVRRGTRSMISSLAPDGSAVTFAEDPGVPGNEGMTWSILSLTGKPPVTIPGRHTYAEFEDSTTLLLISRSGSAKTYSLLDLRSNQRLATIQPQDSANFFGDRVPGRGWAWIALSGRIIRFQRDGSTRVDYRVPEWYRYVFQIAPARDGQHIAFLGWNHPGEDSIGLGVLSLRDGSFRQLNSAYAEGAAVTAVADGAFLLALRDGLDSWVYSLVSADGVIRRLGKPSRRHMYASISSDLKRAFVVTRDYRGDVWSMKVEKRR